MTFEQLVIASIVGVVGGAITTVISIVASRKFGGGPLAKEVDDQEEKLITILKGRVDAAEKSASEANAKADATEAARQRCEEEIGRVKRDLRLAEGELLTLYRITGQKVPRQLQTRHRDHQREESET